jgi:hypothetical protein
MLVGVMRGNGVVIRLSWVFVDGGDVTVLTGPTVESGFGVQLRREKLIAMPKTKTPTIRLNLPDRRGRLLEGV